MRKESANITNNFHRYKAVPEFILHPTQETREEEEREKSHAKTMQGTEER